MSGYNRVIICGRLGADPEVKSFQNGGKVVNLRVATSETWKSKDTGERQERVQWHSVAIFNEGIAGIAERFLSKGSEVLLEGQLETRSWEDQSGQKRYATEIVIRPFGGSLTLIGGGNKNNSQQEYKPQDEEPSDIPF